MSDVISLPASWVPAKFSDVFQKLQYGFTASANWQSTAFRFLRITDLGDFGVDWTGVPFCSVNPADAEKYALSIGDFVFARSGSIEKAWRVTSLPHDQTAVFASYLIRGVPIEHELGPWLSHFLRSKSYLSQIGAAGAGIGMQNINAQKLSDIDFPLPPLNEQRRIVAKLDALFEKSRSIREKLDRLPRLLANLQKSILNSAFRGTDNWKAASVGSVLLDIRYGTSKKCQSEPRGTAVLRIPNIGERGIQIDDLKYAEFTPTESARLALDVGDLLLIRSNGSVDLVGKTAVVSKRETGMLYAGYLIRMRVNRSLILPEFLHYWLMTPSVREIIERTAKSTSGVNNINSEEVRSLPLLLPPLEVQTQICARVAQAFSSIDRLSATFDTAAGKVGMMDMSILSKAFRGELVPQDPNDEPASVLLERIRAQKPVAGTKRGRGRKAAA